MSVLAAAVGALATFGGVRRRFEIRGRANGAVYVDDYAHHPTEIVTALDAATGTAVWITTTGGSIRSSPTVDHGLLYVGSDDGKVYALSAAGGGVVWSTTTGGTVRSSPLVGHGVVYVGSGDSKLYALDGVGGGLLWSTTTGAAVESSASIAHRLVYVGSDDGKLYAIAS